jgi:hypothetical protein
MFIRAAALSLAIVLPAVGHAEDDSGCAKFKWSVARERAWLLAGPKSVAAGAEVAPGAGYEVALVPVESAGFVAPPERAPKPGTFGGVLKIALAKPGAYDVTLSAEAWIDVVQNGASVKSSDFTGQKACPGVRKSVRFDLAAGAATLQISNAQEAKINLAAAPAE